MKKKLFILIWDMGPGGIQKRVRDIVKEIDEHYKNWEVHFFIKFKEPHYFLDELNDRKKVHITFLSKDRRIKRHFPSTLWVMREFIRIKPDVCLTFLEQLSVSMILTKLLFFWVKKTKVVLNEGVFTAKYLDLNRNFFWKNVMKTLIHFFYRFADTIIVPTQQVKNGLVTSFKIPSNNIIVIPNWTLFKPIYKAHVKNEYDFIYLTRFEKEKNPQLFIATIKSIKKHFPHVKALLIGEGRLRDALEEKISKLDLKDNIELLPFTTTPRDFLKKSKILLFTSFNEGMPNTVLEAAMCRVPAVTMNFVGVEEVVIHNNTGLIAKNPTELKKYALAALKDDKLIAKLGTNAQKYILENYSFKTQERFIRTLLS